MKYQCVHTNTGLCETCFKYEQQLSQAEARVKELEQEVLKWEQLVRKRDRAFDKYAEERTRISDEA